MRQLFFYTILMILLISCNQNPIASNSSLGLETRIKYDSTLASEFGADEYGMKQYVMAFLKRGPNRSQDSITAANLQKRIWKI